MGAALAGAVAVSVADDAGVDGGAPAGPTPLELAVAGGRVWRL
jgi:hypothetical protein